MSMMAATGVTAAPLDTTNSTIKTMKMANDNNETIAIISSNTTTTTSHTMHATVATMLESLGPVARNRSRLRKRHSKRHSNWYDYYDYNENSTALEWANPCGGFYEPSAVQWSNRRQKRKNAKQVYNILKRSANIELKTLNADYQVIDISNMDIWFLHNITYKFLPKLKENSSIALKRWYRNMQTYVGSLAYLTRIQIQWDRSKFHIGNQLAHELRRLLFSSRSMLCELETAINNTHPYRLPSNPLPQTTRAQMNKRIKLRTKLRADRMSDVGVGELKVDNIDLKFVKYYYYEFLKTMWKVLRRSTRSMGQNAPLAQQRNDFNEVEKQAALRIPSQQSSGNNRRKSLRPRKRNKKVKGGLRRGIR